MAFQLSPGVNVTEIDLTTIVPAVATSIGAISGVFRWGPVGERVLIDNENTLVSRFGKPTNFNAETWFTAANFLGYSNALQVSRAANTTGVSPVVGAAYVAANSTTVFVSNTAGLSADLYVYASSTNGVSVGSAAKIASIINSTAFSLAAASPIVPASGPNTYSVSVTLNTDANNTTLLTLSSGNTSSLYAGQKLVSSSNASVVNASANGLVTITSVVNSSAVAVDTDVVVANGSATVVFAQGGTVSLNFASNTTFSAVANTGEVANLAAQIIRNDADFKTKEGTFDTDVTFIAKYPGEVGNSLRVSVCGNSSGFSSNINLADYGTSASLVTNVNSNTATLTITAASQGDAQTAVAAITNVLNVSDLLQIGNSSVGFQFLKVTSLSSTTNSTAGVVTIGFEDKLKLSESFTYTDTEVTRYWEYFNLFNGAPGQSAYFTEFGNSSVTSDELHIVVVDEGGKFTGVPGTVLETFKEVSRATDAKTLDGATNFYKNIVNDNSAYIWVVNDFTTAPSATAANLIDSTLDVTSLNFNYGKDGADESNVAHGVLAAGYDLFKSAEDVDISLVLTGKAQTFILPNYLIDNISEARKDCVVFVSPAKSNVVGVNAGEQVANVVEFRNSLRSTSYAVLDSGYKYQYDRYNDIYRWIPLNGDIAGLCARTDNTNDPWWSPAGYNRGQIKNIVRLAYNPGKTDRDELYKNGVNPVVTFPGQGTILFGDKTLLAKPSAFDRINVRRLFIVLEKAISTASKFTLFEFNDEFTRAQFKNLVTPFLRDVQGRRGVTDFLVVCDDSNNTPEVIDRNEFVGDIYIKPARSINFIQLNFVAVRTGVQFSEIVGQF